MAHLHIMELTAITPHIEALVFASDKPVSIAELTDLVNTALSFMDDKAAPEQVAEALEQIREKYDAEAYPFGLTASGGGYQFLTKPAYFKTVALLQSDKYLKRLSTAALETLAVIAYRQPVTKGEMEHIRGVNCDYAVQKLLEKELVTITGRREGSPGQPLEYAASRHFMDYFGMNSLDELPKLNDLFPQDVTEATTITEAHPVEDIMGEAELHMAVNENGEVVEIMEDTVQEPYTMEIVETQEEDTAAPDNETGMANENENTAKTPEAVNKEENDNIGEISHKETGNRDEHRNATKASDSEIENRDGILNPDTAEKTT